MLTSTQKLNDFNFGKDRQLRKYTSESDFSKSQLIGIADRIILKSNEDLLIADSPKSIVLNSPKVQIGSDQANTGIPNGKVLIEILKHLFQAIGAGATSAGGAPCTTNGIDDITAGLSKLQNLNSKKYFIEED